MKNIKVITGVIATLGIFSALLLVTGILFYSAVSSDRLNFQNASALSYQQQELGGSFQTLIETRVTINRVAIRMLKNQRDPASLDAMNTLLTNAGASLNEAEKHFNNYVNSEAIAGKIRRWMPRPKPALSRCMTFCSSLSTILKPIITPPMATLTRKKRRMTWSRYMTSGSLKMRN